ncbi:hypothetical protein GGD41_003488 [Paraburkholderia bryophila]|uniref:Arylsulfotransferase ASST n=1 Tax=Paraburkholderia bryophila TaxID=420952 RepID=A0A7Y9W9B5_9BURK|nr:hypothetical protein [Paraburkholderia bryophila]
MTTTVDQITQRRRGVGLIAHDPQRSAGGYTLIAPQTAGGRVYLVDIRGEVVHEWQMPVRPGRHAVILQTGNLGYNGNHANSEDRYAPWSMWHGGDFYEVTPQGEVVWRYEDPAHHHDAQWLPNGNLLYAACERVPAGFAERVPGGTAHGPRRADVRGRDPRGESCRRTGVGMEGSGTSEPQGLSDRGGLWTLSLAARQRTRREREGRGADELAHHVGDHCRGP